MVRPGGTEQRKVRDGIIVFLRPAADFAKICRFA
jgi:hypothetical protein